jgi:futalosine hydrolase
MKRVLIVTAVEIERAAVLNGLDGQHGVDVLVVGVGSAAAAASTAIALTRASGLGSPYDMVVCMGIGGAFPGRAAIGDVVVGTASVAADLGAETADGFLSVDELGFGTSVIAASPIEIGVKTGTILTVSTVTGSALRAAELAERHPDALAEAMEGYGVACAAAATDTRFVEIRAISNLIGPRDRAAWRIPDALAALAEAAATLVE